MKVVVYAICKNEARFVDRWMASMGEADRVVVLDTGSTDDTVPLLRMRGAAVVQESITPWRFDTARNRSLELVPEDADVCVCTDLDEVFRPGWRKALEQAWTPGTAQCRYHYAWSMNPDGSEGVTFWYEKIHSRFGWKWKHPVHEVLEWTGGGERGPAACADGIRLEHYPDQEKSRGQYLELLELSVKEEPEDDRNMHYLGREYLFRGRWDDCIRTLERHLAMPSATWKDERCASMRYIAQACIRKGEPAAAHGWYLRAAAEAPYLREPYIDLAELLYGLGEWDGVIYFTGCALAIAEKPQSYICEPAAWGSLPHDLRAIAFYRTGRVEAARAETARALDIEPGNARLQGNLRILEDMEKCKYL